MVPLKTHDHANWSTEAAGATEGLLKQEPNMSDPYFVRHPKAGTVVSPAQLPSLTDQLTVEAWVDDHIGRAESLQALVSQWPALAGFGPFSAYDAGQIDDMDTTGFFGAVFDGRYIYFVPQHDLQNRHGKALRYDTHGEFGNAASWQAYDASSTDGLNTKGYYGAVFDGRYIYYVPRRDENRFHSRVLRYDTQGDFKNPASWQAHDAGLNCSYQSAAFDGRYIYFTPGHTVVHKNEVPDQPQCESPPVTGMAPDYFLLGHGTVLRYDTQGAFKDQISWDHYDAMGTDGLDTCDYDGAVYDGRYIYFVPLSTGSVLRYDTVGAFSDPTSWSGHDLKPLGVTLHVGAVFDGRHIYFVPYGDNEVATRYDTHRSFNDDDSWQVFHFPSTPGLTTRGFDGALFDGRYVYYVPYYDGGDIFHGVMLRYDTTSEFTQPSSWSCADGGQTDGLKTVSFNGGATDGRFLYFAAWMDGQSFPERIIGNGRILRYDTTGEQAAFTLRYCDLGHNGGLCAALPGSRFLINTKHGPFSVAANRPPCAGRHHLVGVYDGSTVCLYINGELVGRQPASGRICASDADLRLGEADEGTGRIVGEIEQVYIAHMAHDAMWVKQRYDRQSQITIKDLSEAGGA